MVGAICLIHADSSVRVTKLDLGMTQLGVKARRFIKHGSTIPELYGTMANDIDHNRTKLSEITKYPTNTGPDGVRLLAGPMRLGNHHCRPNCEVRSCYPEFSSCSQMPQWIALDNTAGFVVQALQDIEEGQEIVFNYGADYFEDQRRCPCPLHKEPKCGVGLFIHKSSISQFLLSLASTTGQRSCWAKMSWSANSLLPLRPSTAWASTTLSFYKWCSSGDRNR